MFKVYLTERWFSFNFYLPPLPEQYFTNFHIPFYSPNTQHSPINFWWSFSGNDGICMHANIGYFFFILANKKSLSWIKMWWCDANFETCRIWQCIFIQITWSFQISSSMYYRIFDWIIFCPFRFLINTTINLWFFTRWKTRVVTVITGFDDTVAVGWKPQFPRTTWFHHNIYFISVTLCTTLHFLSLKVISKTICDNSTGN